MNTISQSPITVFKGTAMTPNGASYETHNSGKIVCGIASVVPAFGVAGALGIKHAIDKPDSKLGQDIIKMFRDTEEGFKGKTDKEIVEKLKKEKHGKYGIVCALLTAGLIGLGIYIDKTRNDKSKAEADSAMYNRIYTYA